MSRRPTQITASPTRDADQASAERLGRSLCHISGSRTVARDRRNAGGGRGQDADAYLRKARNPGRPTGSI